jgi:hypothetical protein
VPEEQHDVAVVGDQVDEAGPAAGVVHRSEGIAHRR